MSRIKGMAVSVQPVPHPIEHRFIERSLRGGLKIWQGKHTRSAAVAPMECLVHMDTEAPNELAEYGSRSQRFEV